MSRNFVITLFIWASRAPQIRMGRRHPLLVGAYKGRIITFAFAGTPRDHRSMMNAGSRLRGNLGLTHSGERLRGTIGKAFKLVSRAQNGAY